MKLLSRVLSAFLLAAGALRAAEQTDYPYLLIPWDQVEGRAGFEAVLWLIAGCALLTVVLKGVLAPLLRRLQTAALWRRFERAGLSRGLDSDDCALLARGLRARDAASPLSALESREYFDAFAAPELRRHPGPETADRIRARLFPKAAPPRQDEGDTRDLRTGDRLRIRLQGLPGRHEGVVLANEAVHFTLALPGFAGRSVGYRRGDRVEGVYLGRDSAFGFESRLLDCLDGEVPGCKVAHGPAREIHHRAAPRLPCNRIVRIRRFAAPPEAVHRLAWSELARRPSTEFDVVLRDIGVGGCALEAPPRHEAAKGDFFEIPVRFEDGESASTALGCLVGVEPSPGGAILLHIEFIGLDEEVRHAVGLRLAERVREAASADAAEDGADPHREAAAPPSPANPPPPP